MANRVEKYCSGCKQIKAINNFSKDKCRSDGLQCYCKGCMKKYKYPEGKKKYYLQKIKPFMTSGKRRKNKLWQKYKITIEEYDKMFETQNGVCAICNQPENWKHQNGTTCRLAVDHRHSDKMIRGLLCHHCNLLLGNAREDIRILASAIQYLEVNSGE